ncbi:MAG: hypothetical protein ACE15F_11470 [bacterium]
MRRESLKAVEEMFNRKLIKVEPPYPWPDPPGWEKKSEGGGRGASQKKGKQSLKRRGDGRKRYS